MSENEQHVVALQFSNPPCDGYTDAPYASYNYTLVVLSNVPAEEMKKAYQDGCAKLGFDFTYEVAYGDTDGVPRLSSKHILTLVSHGFDIESLVSEYLDNSDFDINNDDADFKLDYEQYEDLWFWIVKLGNPSFTWSKLPDTSYIAVRTGD